MLANDVTMATGRRYSHPLSQQHTEARRVEHRATADNTIQGEATQFPSNVGQNIDRIWYNHKDTVGAVFDKIGYNTCGQ